jgi:hypothetical protein
LTISDQAAMNALASLLEEMRRTGRKNGRIEVLVEDYKPRELRIVKISESVQLQT